MTPIDPSDSTPTPTSASAAPPIRPATVRDSAVLAALHARAFDEPWSERTLSALLGSPGVFAWLAEGAGFALARAAADEAELLTIAVDPGRRRSGMGAALLEQVIVTALAAGAAQLFLEVAVDNAPALGLYARAGFGRVGRRRGYYARPDGRVDALILTLVLNSRAPSDYVGAGPES